MERTLIQDLIEWKNSKNRQPLILHGARQVGKTYLLCDFGKKHYENYIYVNFESDAEAASYFEHDLDPKEIIKKLELKYSSRIIPGKTLVIFDEIQSSDRALTSLKYFNENANEYHIAAAGSLLGVAVKKKNYSFPVGKVLMKILHPLTFDEFLFALGKNGLVDAIRESFMGNTEFLLHDTAMELYKKYLLVGGMPASVLKFREDNQLLLVPDTHNLILDSYIADMAKYATESESVKIRACFNSIPAQLAKDNKKFQYKLVQKGGSSSIYDVSLEWLISGGIAMKCVKLSACKMPLKAHQEQDSFKLYMQDTGLLTTHSRFNASLMFAPNNLSYTGHLTENYTAQALTAKKMPLYYWASGETEIDFVFQDNKGMIIPIEVKAGENVRSKSLNEYVKKYAPEYSIRISAKNFGFENKIKAVPLYAVFCIQA
jgi:predicted AAA+ superfamily ATPase